MIQKLRRRDLLFGLALAPLAPARAAESDLVDLCRQFHHLRRRCDALEDRNWQAWPDTIGQAETLADTILETPARTTRELALKYDVLLWQLFHDDLEEDRLRSFGAELARLS